MMIDMETKFRAFQLDSPGSLFSYYKRNTYTLIEARIPKGGIPVLEHDLKIHGKETIDVLHITSWDDDHCDYMSLTQIMNHFRPARIEIPGYEPHSDTGKQCKGLILKYDDIHQKYVNNVTIHTEQYIKNLPNAQAWGTSNVVYHSHYNSECHNDMSLIKLFRSAGFNVLSLGDCESKEITKSLMYNNNFIGTEVDVLILPHHGSENSMLTKEFLDFCNPAIAICSSNHDNEYEHPRQSVRQLLSNKDVKLMTTKRGDVILVQRTAENQVEVYNLMSDNNNLCESGTFGTKRNRRRAA